MINFSICIPTYNSTTSLKDAIASVQNQNYPSNLYEILVCEQENKDAFDLCERLKVRYFFLQNKSTYNARKLMMNEATSEYILFLDADDTLDLNTLLTLNNTISSTDKLDLYEFNFVNKNNNKNELIIYNNKKDYLLKILGDSKELYEHNNVSTKCLKKVMTNYVDREMFNYEDGFYLLQLVNDYYNSFCCIGEQFYLVNKNSSGSSKKQTIEKLKNMIFYNLAVLKEFDVSAVIPLIDDTLSNIFNTLITLHNKEDIASFTKNQNTIQFLKNIRNNKKVIREKVTVTKRKYITVILLNSPFIYTLINKILIKKHG